MYPDGTPDSPSNVSGVRERSHAARPHGPGTLFTMQFAVSPGASAWSLNVFGDEDFGLLWDPTPD